jgi:hypothetical protein
VDNFFKDTLEKLAFFLRSLAPGFVLLGALLVVNDGHPTAAAVRSMFRSDDIWLGIGTGVLLGLIAYAVYAGAFEDLVMLFVVGPISRAIARRTSGELDPRLTFWGTVSWLSRERWARGCSKQPVVKELQQELDHFYPWLIFLYCSGSLLIAGSLFLGLKPVGDVAERAGWHWLLRGAALFLACGVYLDVRVTLHEIWLIEDSSQFPTHRLAAQRRTKP